MEPEKNQNLVFLDTNAVIFLCASNQKEFSPKIIEILQNNSNHLFISPLVALELEYLHEVKKLSQSSAHILDHLEKVSAVKMYSSNFAEIFETARNEKWTRDVFDRVITATAKYENAILITKDRNIRKHYKKAIW